MSISRVVPDWTVTHISAEAMRTWCTLLRDENPIHLDGAAAAALGFGPDPVNPGPANLAYLLNMMIEALPTQDIAEVEARFLGQAVAGDSVRASGEAVPGSTGSYDTRLARGDAVLLTARIRMRSDAA